MIAYFDTSALVPLVVAEPSTRACQRIWDDADTVVSTRLLYVEAVAALAQARRLNRLTARRLRACVDRLTEMWPQVDVLEVDEWIVQRAADLASDLGLRGYDAVQCASAERVNDSAVVAVAGDQRLLDAWQHLGIDTVDVNSI